MNNDRTGHVIIVHRWRDHYAHYASYIDHKVRTVTYVTTSRGIESVPSTATGVIVIDDPQNPTTVRDAVLELAQSFGRPEAIIALKEGDLPEVAILREELGCAGRRPEDLARFLDKFEMAKIVAGAGLRLPPLALAQDADAVLYFAKEFGWPVMIKPRRGSASSGVHRLDSPDDVDQVDFERPSIVQAYVSDPIYHVDGVYDGDGLGPWRASRYLNNCLDFTTGQPLGSVEVDDPDLLTGIAEFTTQMARAMCREPWVFHLELFVGTSGTRRPVISFLEVGCRVGGAEIPFIWRDVHGLDLMTLEVALQAGDNLKIANLPPTPEVGGWLLIPPPAQRPCRVVRSCSLIGRPDGPYAEKIRSPGEIIPAANDAFYENVGGRFRFRGRTSAEVEQAMLAAMANFDLECETLAA
ncbi:MAG: ATP-grasp domain-containing protein [Micromonosporaceae bacterium]